MRVKMKSVEAMHRAAGETTTNFYDLDGSKTQCQRLNIAAHDKALEFVSSRARQDYEDMGVPMTFTEGDYLENDASQWLNKAVMITDDDVTHSVRGVGMPLNLQLRPVEHRGLHYCKLLSPFAALEWIYVDS